MGRNLYTARGKAMDKTPWNCHPRPQMRRDSFLCLNGIWDFTVCAESALPAQYDKEILVPFCPESLLSGLQMTIAPGNYLFYRRNFSLPEGFLKKRLLLHIGGADQIADVFVNGQHLCTHIGGYEAFTVDITEALQAENTIVVRVLDDLRDKTLPYGKQSLKRGGMWYTPVSGIWQSVWLESVPESFVADLQIHYAGLSAEILTGGDHNGTIAVQTPDGEQVYPLTNGKAVITPENPRLWSPEDPYLYAFTLRAGEDTLHSYFALRTLESRVIDGIPRLCLNGKPYFFHGVLSQGYWSDGIYTPVSPLCYEDDILALKALGFNTVRKHIKVEPSLFYYACDRLGMVVFQDMVNNGSYSFIRDTALPTIGMQFFPDKLLNRKKEGREAFLTGMAAAVRQLRSHPCIVYWTIFNEGWGQFDSNRVYDLLRQLDSSRFIDTTSGWFRGRKTGIDSRHIYFGPWNQLKAGGKPLVLSEFGGHTYAVEGHLFNPEKAYGYKTCKTLQAWQDSVDELYRTRILPAVKEGLCGAILTQDTDVEDEINSLCTSDRAVWKTDPARMRHLSEALQNAIAGQEASDPLKV